MERDYHRPDFEGGLRPRPKRMYACYAAVLGCRDVVRCGVIELNLWRERLL